MTNKNLCTFSVPDTDPAAAARWSLLVFQEILARVVERPDTAAPKLWEIVPPLDNIDRPPRQLELTAGDVAAPGSSFLFLSPTTHMEIGLTDPTGRISYSTAAGGQIRRVCGASPCTLFLFHLSLSYSSLFPPSLSSLFHFSFPLPSISSPFLFALPLPFLFSLFIFPFPFPSSSFSLFLFPFFSSLYLFCLPLPTTSYLSLFTLPLYG